VLAEGGIDHADIEVDLRGIRILFKDFESLVVFFIVVVFQSFDPALDFL